MGNGRIVGDHESRPRNQTCALCGGWRASQASSAAAAPTWFVRGYEQLTAREREVALWLGRGLHNRDIAALLGTAPDTVRKQTLRIYQKVSASGRIELAIWMALAGYLT